MSKTITSETPTAHLRFVERIVKRPVPDSSVVIETPIRILQQKWEIRSNDETIPTSRTVVWTQSNPSGIRDTVTTEWRDVPLVTEPLSP